MASALHDNRLAHLLTIAVPRPSDEADPAEDYVARLSAWVVSYLDEDWYESEQTHATQCRIDALLNRAWAFFARVQVGLSSFFGSLSNV